MSAQAHSTSTQDPNWGVMSDSELVQAFKQANLKESAFREIIRRYQKTVYYHVRHLLLSHDDADDAAQNSFIRIWENLDGFRGDSQLKSWIYRVSTNEALNVLRKRKPNVDFDEAQPEMADYLSEPTYMNESGIEKQLQKALCYLPYKQKLVFVLRYFEDLDYELIGELTNTSVGALKSSYHHAVKKLEIYLNVLR
jgi:RNA polymerase sigma factor (sigma-70 family)